MMDDEKENAAEMFNLEQQLSGDFGRSITAMRRTADGVDSEVYSAKMDGQDVFVKVNDDEALWPVQESLLPLLRAQGIPTPTVLDFKIQTSLGKPVMIETAVPGRPLKEITENRSGLYRQAGGLLAKMHQVELPGFGYLERVEGQLHGSDETWRETLLDRREWVLENLSANELLTASELESLLRAWDQVVEIPCEQGVCLHGDYQGAHIFSDGQMLTGLIDFGGARSGDPRYDLAITKIFFPEKEWTDFRAGYGALADDPAVGQYQAIIAARKLEFRHRTQRPQISIESIRATLRKALTESF